MFGLKGGSACECWAADVGAVPPGEARGSGGGLIGSVNAVVLVTRYTVTLRVCLGARVRHHGDVRALDDVVVVVVVVVDIVERLGACGASVR